MARLMPEEMKTVAEEIARKVAPEALIEATLSPSGELTLMVAREHAHGVIQALRDDPRTAFNALSDVTAVDYLELAREPRFDVIYHLVSYEHAHRIRLHAPVPEDEEACSIRTVTDMWSGASFMERETYDMFGIRFEGHPNLTRILMPDNWIGHPLRKDHPLGGATSFYYKQDTDEYAGEPDDLVPRIRVQDSDV